MVISIMTSHTTLDVPLVAVRVYHDIRYLLNIKSNCSFPEKK